MRLSLLVTLLIFAVQTGGEDKNLSKSGESKFTAKTTNGFQFGGGTLDSFLNAIRETFEVDVKQIGTVPPWMLSNIRVPKVRMSAPNDSLDFRSVLTLYNEISAEGDPTMGHWVIKGVPPADPQAILLVSSFKKEEFSFSIKAFALQAETREVGQKKFELIRDTVENEKIDISPVLQRSRSFHATQAALHGNLRYHPEAGIIVATGGEVYVELASAIIEAFRSKVTMTELATPAKPK